RQLSEPVLAQAAAGALAALGEDVLPHLESFPQDARARSRDDRLQRIPEVLARTRHPRALALLSSALDIPNVRLRSRVVSAYAELVVRCGEVRARRDEIARAALAEIAGARERMDMAQRLEPTPDLELVA